MRLWEPGPVPFPHPRSYRGRVNPAAQGRAESRPLARDLLEHACGLTKMRRRHVTVGKIADVKQLLPKDLRSLWSE